MIWTLKINEKKIQENWEGNEGNNLFSLFFFLPSSQRERELNRRWILFPPLKRKKIVVERRKSRERERGWKKMSLDRLVKDSTHCICFSPLFTETKFLFLSRFLFMSKEGTENRGMESEKERETERLRKKSKEREREERNTDLETRR